jgi:hypothetical protein
MGLAREAAAAQAVVGLTGRLTSATVNRGTGCGAHLLSESEAELEMIGATATAATLSELIFVFILTSEQRNAHGICQIVSSFQSICLASDKMNSTESIL